MGDYYDMVSNNNGAYLAWAATFNGEQDVYYSYIRDVGTVPVELISFSSFISENIVSLNWTTATELNNHGFEVERSLNNKSWATIGFREGKGTTSEPQQYSYSDQLSDIAVSKLYYRLKQIDFSGSYEYSNVVEVEILPKTFSLNQNFPNPFNPSTHIQYEISSRQFVSLKVFDVLGKEVATLVNEEKPVGTYKVEFNAELNVNPASGVFFYQLKVGDYVATKKMVLMK